MNITFSDTIVLRENILVSALQNESVILNLNRERYFGLNEVGTRMLELLTTEKTIQDAYDRLLDEYHVDKSELRSDLIRIVESLVESGLVEVTRVS